MINYETQSLLDGTNEITKLKVADALRSCPSYWSGDAKRRYVFANLPLSGELLADILKGTWTKETLYQRWWTFCLKLPSFATFQRLATPSGQNKSASGSISPLMKEAHGWYECYLRTAYWRTIRERVRRYYITCCSCGSEEDLEIHHKNGFAYSRCGQERIPQDLCLFCADCHDVFHSMFHLGVPSKPPENAKIVLRREGVVTWAR